MVEYHPSQARLQNAATRSARQGTLVHPLHGLACLIHPSSSSPKNLLVNFSNAMTVTSHALTCRRKSHDLNDLCSKVRVAGKVFAHHEHPLTEKMPELKSPFSQQVVFKQGVEKGFGISVKDIDAALAQLRDCPHSVVQNGNGCCLSVKVWRLFNRFGQKRP